MATALEMEVLPTPPLPVKNRNRVGLLSHFIGRLVWFTDQHPIYMLGRVALLP